MAQWRPDLAAGPVGPTTTEAFFAVPGPDRRRDGPTGRRSTGPVSAPTSAPSTSPTGDFLIPGKM